MKCLVFGASGYLGRHLLAALQDAGHADVACPARTGPEESRVDIRDPGSLAKLDWAVDVVYLFAGVTGTAASLMNAQAYVTGNEIGLLNVLDAIRQSAHRPRVVFPSSRLVYKGSIAPLAENAELEAKTVYGANKIACEHFLRAYANAFDIPHTICRICVPYGNSLGREYSFGTVGNFIRQAMEHGRIRLYGDGSLRRTFTHIDDLCGFLVGGALREDFRNQTCNLPGDDLSLLEAAQLIAAQLDAEVAFAPWPPFDLSIESGSTVFDSGKVLSHCPAFQSRHMAAWAAGIVPLRVP